MSSPQDPQPHPPISSLYGPGALTCWLSQLLSLSISWSRSTLQTDDTITSDLLAGLSLPIIASFHLPVTALRSKRHPENLDLVTLTMTLTICRLFCLLAPVLVLVSKTGVRGYRIKRFGLVGVVLAHCYYARYVVQISLGWGMPLQEILVVVEVLVGVVAVVFVRVCVYARRRIGFREKYLIPLSPILLYLPLLPFQLPRNQSQPFLSSESATFIIPDMPHSFSDLDQAVAAAIGGLTIYLAATQLRRSATLQKWQDFTQSWLEFDSWREEVENRLTLRVDPDENPWRTLAARRRAVDELHVVNRHVKALVEAPERKSIERFFKDVGV